MLEQTQESENRGAQVAGAALRRGAAEAPRLKPGLKGAEGSCKGSYEDSRVVLSLGNGVRAHSGLWILGLLF